MSTSSDCLLSGLSIQSSDADALSTASSNPINFVDQLNRVNEFFKPENLAKQKIKYEGEIGLLVIDAQIKFCDPEGKRGNQETKRISERIQSLMSEFRKINILIYAVYFSREEIEDPEKIDFYQFKPDLEDKLIRKTADSAFRGSSIKEVLKEDKKKLLLACGFNASACVRSTVLDAKESGFDVCVLEDLTGNDQWNGKYA